MQFDLPGSCFGGMVQTAWREDPAILADLCSRGFDGAAADAYLVRGPIGLPVPVLVLAFVAMQCLCVLVVLQDA